MIWCFPTAAAAHSGIQESLLDALQISAGLAGEQVGGLLLCLILSAPPPGLAARLAAPSSLEQRS